MRHNFIAIAVAVVGGWGCGSPLGGECENCGAEGSGASTGEGASAPYGYEACVARYFADSLAVCTASDCGEAMSCWTDPDCASCSDRCMPVGCYTSSDCVSAYEGLCDGIIWQCTGSIVASNLRCLPMDEASSDCGDGSCDSTEDCVECEADCGYCEGDAPLLTPCTDHSECASEWCLGNWCSDYCESPADCHTNPEHPGECAENGDGDFVCFPRCDGAYQCPYYSGTQCFTGPDIDGADVLTCAF